MKIICNFQRIFVPSVQHVSTLTERLSRSSARVKCSLWSKSSVVRQVGTSPQLWLCKPIYDFFFLFSKEKFVKLTKLDIREFWSSFKAAVLFAFKVNLRSSKKPPKIMTKWKLKIVSKQHRHKKKKLKTTTKKKIMVSRRKILSRSRDELHSDIYFMAEDDDEDVWYSKEKLYRVSSIIFTCFRYVQSCES